jgi:hypothetical protein
MKIATPAVPDVTLHGLELKSDILVCSNRQYWEFYPTLEALALRSVERTADGVGIVLKLETAFVFDSLDVTGRGDGLTTVEGDTIILRFPNVDALKSQFHELTITALSVDGDRTPPHRMAFQFASKAADAAHGRTGHNRVIVKDSDLQLAYSRVADWIIDLPSEEDRAYAQQRWGALTANLDGAYAKARAVTRAVMDDFEPQRGTPSDVMNRLHPFRQHERILAGLDHGWCANMAEVLCHGLNSLEVPCRLVRMRNTYHQATSAEPGENFEVLLAGGHTIAEIYDAVLKQWIWLDPSQRQLGARDAGGHLLNLAEIHYRLNLPHQAADLRFEHYDPATQTETVYAFADSPIRPNLLNFAKREQRFYYFKRRDATVR